jgi:hypothetical protein
MAWDFFAISLGRRSHLPKTVVLVTQVLMTLLYGGVQITTRTFHTTPFME